MARYDDNTAYDLGASAFGQQAPASRREPREFNVVEGGNVSHARALSPVAMTVLKCVAAAAAVMFVAGLVKVALISAASSYLAQNAELDSQLEAARYSASELEVQNSIYSDKDRVWSIATQVYGMTYPEQSAQVDLAGSTADVTAETE